MYLVDLEIPEITENRQLEMYVNLISDRGDGFVVGGQNVKKDGTHPNFAKPDITTFCAEVFHSIQSKLSEVPRVLASACNERKRYISVCIP